MRVTSTFLFILLSISTASSYGGSCKFATETFQNRLQQKFKQNPIRLVETFTDASHKLFLKDIDSKATAKIQNQILTSSFDIKLINQALVRNLKTRSVTRYMMDWVRTQYWGSVDQLYYNKEITLKSFAADLLAPHELDITRTHPVFTKATKLTSRKCNAMENKYGFCPGVVFETQVQFSPYISCRQDVLKKPFTGKYLLSYRKNQGFKIIDIELSGKRIVLSSLDFLNSQKRKGLNSAALTSQLKILSSNAGSFIPPSVIPHSNNFLAKFNTPTPRLPASL